MNISDDKFDEELDWYFTKPLNLDKNVEKNSLNNNFNNSLNKNNLNKNKRTLIKRLKPGFSVSRALPQPPPPVPLNPTLQKMTFNEVPAENVLEYLGIIKPPGTLSIAEEIKLARKKSSPAKKISKNPLTGLNPSLTHIVDEYDEADFGDTYDDYTPSKLKIGVKHPDSVVESSSLSVVLPPDINYRLKIPAEVFDACLLSSLQLESVVYACQKHNDFLPSKFRAGYLIGDGPGVGKGRIISGVIFENMLCGRTRALWVSVSSDLKYDAQNDLEDIGCDVNVISLQKLSYNERIDEVFEEFSDVGVLFSTYASLIGESHSVDTLYQTRYSQIIDWLTLDFDGVIIFDECHKAKNLKPSGNAKPTKTALTVLKLQNDLPKARIVYCSATGASEPRNMAYMVRLGLWGPGTPFPEFDSFLTSVERRGVGAMELVAIDMKQRGVYLARQLSFSGVSFKVLEISLSSSFISIYNKCVVFWDKALDFFERASDLVGYSSRDKSFMLANFYSSHQRFFKALCIASKVESIVNIAKKALSENKAVVIGLQSTGESVSSQLVKQNRYNKIVSTVYGILVNLINKQFPFSDRKGVEEKVENKRRYDEDSLTSEEDEFKASVGNGVGNKRKISVESNELDNVIQVNMYDWNSVVPQVDNKVANTLKKRKEEISDQCLRLSNELLQDINDLQPFLPPNTLDELIDKLGGPDSVAEMTGRKGRFVRISDNEFTYESRSNEETSLELVNVHERDNFMQGRKFVAIISEAASSGISLQSDRRVANTRKRLHITLELSWSADRAIQQFGRTHRSNQISPPEYLFVISELAGEKRFACVVAKRLESLGALTHGDRRATETRDLSQFNIDTKYGRYALDLMLDILHGQAQNPVSLPKYDGNFIEDARNISGKLFKSDSGRGDSKNSENSPKIHKFLNRLLGVKVDLQNAIYEFYTNIMDHCIKDAKGSGKYDFGIVDLGIGGEMVEECTRNKHEMQSSSGTTIVELITFKVERGLSFNVAKQLLERFDDPNVGFYVTKELRGRFRQCVLVLKSQKVKNQDKVYTLSRPNIGIGTKTDYIENITKAHIKITPNEVQEEWTRFYESAGISCIHKYYHGFCKVEQKIGSCELGKRVRPIHLLCGAIFSMWNIIEDTFENSPIRMARILTKDKARRIGIMIPTPYIPRLNTLLMSRKKLPKYEIFKNTEIYET